MERPLSAAPPTTEPLSAKPESARERDIGVPAQDDPEHADHGLAPPAAPPSIWPRLLVHACALVCLQSTLTSVSFLLPIIARKQFNASDLETTVITSANNVLAILSIFWGAFFPRMRLSTYTLLYFFVSLVPLGLCALAQNYTQFCILAVLSAIGNAGWTPIAGDLLRRFYPAELRGKVFGLLVVIVTLFAAGGSLIVGRWMGHNPDAFRIYMPIAVGIQLVGVAILLSVARQHRGFVPDVEPSRAATVKQALRVLRRPRAIRAGLYDSAIRPILHAGEVLKADRVFARYEAAFMTYGIGWMTAWGLLPLVVTEKLKLDYQQINESTQFVYLALTVLVTLPAGWLVDRIGAMRTCMIAFAFYALWPIGIILADSPGTLVLASVAYGACSSLVNMGWMLGPVTLAPTADKVPQYIAIHTTMVGLRAILFMFGALGLYTLTGSFTIPLAIGAIAFWWASYQMWRLSVIMKGPRAAPAPAD